MKKDENVIAIIVALAVFVVILIAYGAYTGTLKPETTEISKEKTIEEVKEEYEAKLEDARRDTLDQHMQLVMVDNDALAVDLVYIDSRRNKHYVEYLLGDNSWVETMKRGNSSDMPLHKDSYDFDSDYTVRQFDELVRILKEDNAKMLAVEIVEEYYSNSDNGLTIPDRRMRQSIKNGLKSSDNKDDDGEDGVYNDKPHASISEKPDQPKYDKSYGKN